MINKSQHLKIPASVVAIYGGLLALSLFFSYSSYLKTKTPSSTPTTTADFAATKSNRPEFQFFVMSFCPYGNQIEASLKPVAELLGDKADIRPQYIFEKISDLKAFCQSRSGNPSLCSTYVQNKYFATIAECQKTLAQNLATCLEEKNYIKANGAYYSSLHGRSEANQDVREICAWNQTPDKKVWWNFVDAINKNCNVSNVDSCWEQEAKRTGLDTNQITQCFNQQAISLIEGELKQTTKYNVTGSPTLIVNGVTFPPDNAYTQNGQGGLKIGKKTFTQDKYRTSNTLKEALCASFAKIPKECRTTLPEPQTAPAAAGGCGN